MAINGCFQAGNESIRYTTHKPTLSGQSSTQKQGSSGVTQFGTQKPVHRNQVNLVHSKLVHLVHKSQVHQVQKSC